MNYKPILKAVNMLDDVGSAIARKTGNKTIGAAVEGAIVTGAEGAILGGIAGAIDEDSSVGEGMVKGALIGGAVGGISQGALSNYLQKNPRINAMKTSSGAMILEGAVDYSRAGQNSLIFGARKGLIKDVSHATANMHTGEISFANMSDAQVAKWIAEYRV